MIGLKHKKTQIIAFSTLLFITRTKVLKVSVVAILYGGAIELIQPIVGRNAEVMDLAADICGVIFAVVVALFLQRVAS